MTIFDLRECIYKNGRFYVRTQAPLISVGNLTMGGSGKTPMMDFLIEHLKVECPRVVSLHRTYKSQLNQRSEVIDLNASYFGDEPVLIKRKHPEIRVFVGPVKRELAKWVDTEIHPDLILLDDGFSHPGLYRHLNILMVDASRPLHEFRIFPFGRARESLKSQSRADVIVFTRMNQARTETIQAFAASKVPRFHSRVEWIRLRSVRGEFKKLNEWSEVSGFSGLANNQAFRESLKEKFQVQIFNEFPDHHTYSVAEIRGLLRGNSLNWLTTEKDMVKIQSLDLREDEKQRIYAVESELQLEEPTGLFLDQVRNHIFKKF